MQPDGLTSLGDVVRHAKTPHSLGDLARASSRNLKHSGQLEVYVNLIIGMIALTRFTLSSAMPAHWCLHCSELGLCAAGPIVGRDCCFGATCNGGGCGDGCVVEPSTAVRRRGEGERPLEEHLAEPTSLSCADGAFGDVGGLIVSPFGCG